MIEISSGVNNFDTFRRVGGCHSTTCKDRRWLAISRTLMRLDLALKIARALVGNVTLLVTDKTDAGVSRTFITVVFDAAHCLTMTTEIGHSAPGGQNGCITVIQADTVG